MLKIRRPLGRLIFNMGIAIPGKTVFLIETAPWVCFNIQTIFPGIGIPIMKMTWLWDHLNGLVQFQCISNGVMSFLHKAIDLIFIMEILILVRHYLYSGLTSWGPIQYRMRHFIVSFWYCKSPDGVSVNMFISLWKLHCHWLKFLPQGCSGRDGMPTNLY